MPESIFYVRGFQPSLAEYPAANSDMVNDLKVIANLPDELVQTIRQRLSEADGFLDPKSLLGKIRDVIEDSNAEEAVRKALQALAPIDVERLLRSLDDELQKESSPFDQETVDGLKRVLPELIKPYPGLVRFRKAERLSKVTGNELESVELICDLRPVFDEGREAIEGMMPYTRMRVITTGADGLPKSFEAELTRLQVETLAEKANKAKEKLDVLSKSVQTWIPGGLPDLPLTRAPRKDSKDA